MDPQKSPAQLEGPANWPRHDSSQVALHVVHDARHPAIFTGAVKSWAKAWAREQGSERMDVRQKWMISWDFMGFHGISWDFMGFHGISWDFMGFHGI